MEMFFPTELCFHCKRQTLLSVPTGKHKEDIWFLKIIRNEATSIKTGKYGLGAYFRKCPHVSREIN